MKIKSSGALPLAGSSPVKSLINDEYAKKILPLIRELARANSTNHAVYQPASIEFHIEAITAAFFVLYNTCITMLKPASQVQSGSAEKERNRVIDVAAQKKINHLHDTNDTAQEELQGLPSILVVPYYVTIAFFEVLLFLGEVFLLSSAFQMSGKSFSTSLLMASAVSLGLLLAAEYVPFEINKLPTMLLRRLARILFAVIICIVFYAINQLRSGYTQLVDGVAVSPLMFTMISVIVYVAQVLILEYCLRPASSQVCGAFRAVRLRTGIFFRNRQITDLEASREHKDEALFNRLSERLSNINEAEEIIPLLNSLYKEGVVGYKRMYLDHLPASEQAPPAFFEPIPDLLFPVHSQNT